MNGGVVLPPRRFYWRPREVQAMACFSLGWPRQGMPEQIYDASLLDWSAPRGFDFDQVVGAALAVARSDRSHLLRIKGRGDLPDKVAGAIKRRYPIPNEVVRSTKQDAKMIADRLIVAGVDNF